MFETLIKTLKNLDISMSTEKFLLNMFKGNQKVEPAVINHLKNRLYQYICTIFDFSNSEDFLEFFDGLPSAKRIVLQDKVDNFTKRYYGFF